MLKTSNIKWEILCSWFRASQFICIYIKWGNYGNYNLPLCSPHLSYGFLQITIGHLIPAAKRLKNHNGIPVSQNSIGLFEKILLDSLCNLNKAQPNKNNPCDIL
jgi:hypothetical protein